MQVAIFKDGWMKDLSYKQRDYTHEFIFANIFYRNSFDIVVNNPL